MTEVIKGRISDISDDFLNKLDRSFPESITRYDPDSGDTLEQLAYKSGQRYIVEWIKKHANKSTSTG